MIAVATRHLPRAMRTGAVLALLSVGLVATPAGADVAPGPYSGPAATLGTNFWFAFGANYYASDNLVNISGATATTATVSVPAIGFSTDVAVTPGQTTTVELPPNTNLSSPDGTESLAVHVTSSSAVTVYGLEDLTASTDGFTALPTTALGTDYYVLGYEALPGDQPEAEPSDFQIVGTHDGTTVTITPSADTALRSAGTPYTVTLDAGETYELIGLGGADLTGTHITSTMPVSVLAGAQCANIPNGTYYACNYVGEQLPPTPEWGKQFLTEPLAGRTAGDTFRVLAAQNGTRVTVNGSLIGTLDAGQFVQTQLADPSTIATSQPALVAQYSDSTAYDNVAVADPSETLVPPTAQFLRSYTYATPADGRFTNYVNVIVPNAATGSLTVDGSAIPSSSFATIGDSGFSGAQLPVDIGTHVLSASAAFGLTAYGFGSYDAYSYPGGYATSQLATTTTRYVALGDSYSSGEGALDVNGNAAFDPATDTSLVYQNLCHRSAHAYPQLVRRDPRVRAQSFTFGACSGARLPHLVASVPRVGDALTGESGGQWGESAQLDRIAPAGSADSSVNLVTLSISGNDFGFSEIVRACAHGPGTGNSFGACIDKISSFRSIGAMMLMNGATVHMDNSGDGGYTICRGTCSGPRYVRVPQFTDILADIHRRAPNATIVIVGYPHLLPEHPAGNCTLGFSGLAHYWMPPENIALIDDGEEYVDDMIQNLVLSAAYHGLPVRFADPRGVFNRHDACQVHDRHGQPQTHAWINGLLFDGVANPSPYSMHPNAAGQAAYAGLVAGCYANPQTCGSDPYTSNLIAGDGGLPPGTAIAAPVRPDPPAALTLASPTGSAPHAPVGPPRVVLHMNRPASGAHVLTGRLTVAGPCLVRLLVSLPGGPHGRPVTLGGSASRFARSGTRGVRIRLAGGARRGRHATARRLLVTLRVTGAGAVRTTTMTLMAR